MSNYSVLKQDINNNIYENQTQQITGTVLNAILNEMTASLGAGYQFAGVATLGMNPGDPDQRVFYLAGEGIYTSFGGIQVPAGKLGVLKWDNRWTLQTIDGLGGGGANLTGYVSVASTDDLPDEGQPTLGYLCGTNLYLYVGEGGDTKEGKYQNCGSFRGPEGAYIQDIEQTETSHENGGRNTIKMTLSDGRSFNVYVHNGTTSSGLFPTLEALQAAYPSPVVGQYAFVGAGFPADIYVCTTAGTWTDSGEDYDGDNVDLTDYATKAEVNQLEAEAVEKKPGLNLFDKSTAKVGYIINASGNEEANASYNASDYIAVDAEETYYKSTEMATPFRFVNYYNSAKTHIGTRSSDVNTFTTPANCAFVRVTFYTGTSYNNYAQVSKQNTNYVPFDPVGGYTAEKISDNIVSTAKIQNKAVTLEKLGDDVIAKIEDVASLENIKDHNSSNLVNPEDVLPGYWNSGYVSSDSYKYVHLDISGLTAGSTLTCMNSTKAAKLMRFCQFYNGNTYKSGVSDVNNTTIPNDVDNVYITFYIASVIDGDNSNIGVFNSASPTWEKYAKYTEAKWTERPENEQALARLADINVKYIEDVPSKNLMNPADVQVGYWNTGYVNNSSYRYFKLDLTKIAAGSTLSALRSTGVSATMRFCQFYKGATLKDNRSSVTSATVPNDVDSVYISFEYPTQFPNSTIANCGVFNSASPEWSPYEIYTKALWTSKPSNSQALARIADLDTVISSKLKGKKWCPLGDSFTEGVTNTTISEGIYAGEKKVYPYFIGNRTGINVVDTFFASGRTLAFPATPGDFTNSICNPSASCYYQNIPADVDYITIYLGINDSHHAPGSGGGDGEDNTGEIPIGTITDNNTSTYYGAWNVVLSWLIENRPFAHIGIIVSNGCDTAEYRTAQIAIARKYGIPFIDLNGDDNTPFMIRSMNSNIPSAIRTIRTEAQAVNYPDNTHPNDDAHEFESYFIESFLERI